MSDKTTNKAEKVPTVQMTARIPVDLVNWVDEQALVACNSKSGIVKLALTCLRQARESAPAQPAKG